MSAWRNRLASWLTTHTVQPDETRRGRLLALFLLTACGVMTMLLAIDLAEYAAGVVRQPHWLITDLATLGVFAGIYYLNRRGRVRLAGYCLLGTLLLVPTVLLPLDTLNNSLVVYALPVALASFIISPPASLIVALVAAGAYVLLNAVGLSGSPFNYLGIMALLVLAFVVWVVADWLQRAFRQTQAAEARLLADIARREQIEIELSASEQRFRHLVENVGEGIAIVDNDERFVLANPAAESIFGTAPGGLVGRSLLDFIPPDQHAFILSQTQRRLNGETGTYEVTIQQPGGARRALRVTATPQHDGDGRCIGSLGLFFDLTDRLRAEEDLRRAHAQLEQRVAERTTDLDKSEKRLRAIFEATPIPQIITRLADTTVLNANQPVCDLFEIDRDQLIGQKARDYFRSQRQFRQLVLDVHRKGHVDQAEVEALTARGNPIWVAVSMRLLTYPGEPALITGFYDITERRRAEQVVRDSEAKFRSVVEQSHDGIVLTDAHGLIVEWNRGMETITGWARSQVLGRWLADAGLTISVHDRLPATDSQTVELDYVRADGHRRNLQVVYFPIDLEHDRMYCAISRDVTARRQAEDALRESAARFHQIADNIREVFWMSLPDKSKLLYVSPAYEDIWGRTCDSLYADPGSWPASVHPDDLAAFDRFWQRQQRGEAVFAEYRIIRADGTPGWIWDRAFPVRDEQGQVYRLVGVAEDVTERKRAEEELRLTLAKEQELGRLKSSFISMASHEFRTPLAGILSAAELLEHYGHKWPDDKKQRYLQRIQTNVQSMTRLLDDMLTIGRAEAGRVVCSPAPLEVAGFCRELIEEVQLADQAQHPIDFEFDLPAAPLLLDAQLLRQILMNLLSNAVKYSPPGASVRLTVDRDTHWLVLRVTDHGIGIPPAAQPHLFDTFFRADNVGDRPGTGLGLAIVRRSVEAHGGTISFKSEPGRGTTFEVNLPVFTNLSEESA
jgi:PAS domain S-box-containing protein